jgi:phosphatidylserine decarboxylase
MTKHLANKIKMYSDYLSKKDYISFLYHFNEFEIRELYEFFRSINVDIPLKGSPNDAKSVVVMFRKLMADSYAYEDQEIKISRYGFDWKDRMSGAHIRVAYSPTGNNAWVIHSESSDEEPFEESGVGYNKLIDKLTSGTFSLFYGQSGKDYYL